MAVEAGEPLPVALKRISVGQFDHALRGLRGGIDERDRAIHEARKAMKRLRAILRMVRPLIGDRVYRAENSILRDTAGVVAGVRDGLVMVDAVAGLRKRYSGVLAPRALSEVEDNLRARHERMRAKVLGDEGGLEQVVNVLYRARSRYLAWPVDGADPDYDKRGIPDRFSALSRGVGQTYERGRGEMLQAYGAPRSEHFHLWRKRVKYLRHQMEVIAPVWPEVVGGLASSLADLGDVLGEEHDMAELVHLLSGMPELCPDPVERSLLAALAHHRRAELQGAARVMGSRIYAESPKQFTNRLSAYWAAWVG
jgi:CHAD domain-containing protein